MSSKDKIVATLTMIVEYEEIPDTEELRTLVEDANGIGSVKQADLVIIKDSKQDLLR